jgi:hypothetical protein
LPVPAKSLVKREGGEGERVKIEGLVSLLRDWVGLLTKALPYCRRLLPLRSLKIKSFHMELGTGDAAETGILTGLLWSFLGIFQHHLGARTGRGKFTIIPHFNRQVLRIEVSGILQVQPGHIITVMGQLLAKIIWEKYGKGVDAGGRTSNSRFNENCHGEY